MKKTLLLLGLLVAVAVAALWAQPPSHGVWAYLTGPAGTVLKMQGYSAGTPVMTASKLIDNGSNLQYNTNSVPVFMKQLTTTAATSDAFTITGVTSTSFCTFSAANASAATNIATSYVSAYGTNSVTLTHTATSGMIYNFTCTAA